LLSVCVLSITAAKTDCNGPETKTGFEGTKTLFSGIRLQKRFPVCETGFREEAGVFMRKEEMLQITVYRGVK
jgi:hypothetical protein